MLMPHAEIVSTRELAVDVDATCRDIVSTRELAVDVDATCRDSVNKRASC